jgi:hypothetical protein
MAANTRSTGTNFRETRLGEFPKLDHEFYRETTSFFENRGFRSLGDIEDAEHNRKNPSLRTCLRILSDKDGDIRVIVHHVGTSGLSKYLDAVVPNLKYVSLETEFMDGSVMSTTNDFFSNPRRNVDLLVKAEAGAEELLDLHVDRIKEYRDANPSVEVWKASSLGEVLEGFRRVAKMKKKLTPWNKKGFFGNVYKLRRPIAKIFAIVLIGAFLGSIWLNSEKRRFDEGRALTAERYEQQYGAFRARAEEEPRRAPWTGYAAGLVMMLLIFGTYEGMGKGGAHLIGRLLSRYRAGNEEIPFSPEPVTMEKIRKSTMMGKVAALILIGVLIGGGLAAREAEKQDRRPVSKQRYMENYDKFKQKATEPLDETYLYYFQSIFLSLLLLGLYELGGKTLEGGAQLYYCKRMDLDVHMVISNVWMVVGFFGSGILIAPFLLRKMENVEAIIKLPIIFGSIFGVVFLISKLFDRVPVACPKCRQKAYRNNRRNPIIYVCRSCKHKHQTNFGWR